MFYNNMYETSSKLNEIIILNRQLRNLLSMKGGNGRNDLLEFKEKLKSNNTYIFSLFILCFISIIIFSINNSNINSNINLNKKFIGGSGYPFKSIIEIIKEQFNIIINIISENLSNGYGQLLELTKKNGSTAVLKINENLELIYSSIGEYLWTTSMGVLPPLIPLIIIIVILFYFCSNFILDRKLYLPCWGCQEGTIFFKCAPGTGKGSIGCTIYTELLDKIKLILKQFKYVGDLINKLKEAISIAINSILYLLDHITGWVSSAFSQSIGKIFDALKFLKHINIPDNWGFNLGNFLLCPNFSLKGEECIYNKDGSLRNDHGNNPLFQSFWKMIRIILEVPPNIPKFPLGGGKKLNLDIKAVEKPSIEEPTIEKHEVDTKVGVSSKKKVDAKDIVYENLLKVLIKIDINPIKWLAALFNLLVDAINLVIEGITLVLKEIISFIFSIIVEAANAITGALGNIFSDILKPIDEVVALAAKIPKQIFKTIKNILEVGIFPIITHFFYMMLLNVFPFLKYIKSFIIVITLVILIMSILIFCPMIGAYYSFFEPYNFIKNIINQVSKYIFNSYENFNQNIVDFVSNSSYKKEITIYLDQMKDSYKYVSGIIIIIIIIFIVLNMFTNINKKFLTIIKDIIYNRYSSKINIVIEKYKKFKKRKLKEENEKEKEIEKNENTLNKINNIKNLTINQIKDFFN